MARLFLLGVREAGQGPGFGLLHTLCCHQSRSSGIRDLLSCFAVGPQARRKGFGEVLRSMKAAKRLQIGLQSRRTAGIVCPNREIFPEAGTISNEKA